MLLLADLFASVPDFVDFERLAVGIINNTISDDIASRAASEEPLRLTCAPIPPFFPPRNQG